MSPVMNVGRDTNYNVKHTGSSIARAYFTSLGYDVDAYQMCQPAHISAYRSVAKYDQPYDHYEKALDPQCVDLAFDFLQQHFYVYCAGSVPASLDMAMYSTDKTTSCGYPWNISVFNKSAFFDKYYNVCRDFWNRMHLVPLWFVSIKKEIRSRDRINFFCEIARQVVQKLRTFTAAPVHFTVFLIMLCLDFNNKFYQSHNRTWSIVGMTKFYRGFDSLYNRLTKNNDPEFHKNAFELDCEEYDSRLLPTWFVLVMRFRFMCMAKVYQTSYYAIRYVFLYTHIVYSFIVLTLGELVRKRGGNPSGSGNTITDNTLILYMLFAYAWCKLAPEHMHNYNDFSKHVCAALCGDDNTYTCSDVALKFFTPDKIRSVLAAIGNKVTSPNDAPRKLEECAFLSHNWIWNEQLRLWLPRMERAKVISSLCNNTETDDVRWTLLRAYALRVESWADVELRSVIMGFIQHIVRKHEKKLIGSIHGITIDMIHTLYKSDAEIAKLYAGLEADSATDWEEFNKITGVISKPLIRQAAQCEASSKVRKCLMLKNIMSRGQANGVCSLRLVRRTDYKEIIEFLELPISERTKFQIEFKCPCGTHHARVADIISLQATKYFLESSAVMAMSRRTTELDLHARLGKKDFDLLERCVMLGYEAVIDYLTMQGCPNENCENCGIQLEPHEAACIYDAWHAVYIDNCGDHKTEVTDILGVKKFAPVYSPMSASTSDSGSVVFATNYSPAGLPLTRQAGKVKIEVAETKGQRKKRRRAKRKAELAVGKQVVQKLEGKGAYKVNPMQGTRLQGRGGFWGKKIGGWLGGLLGSSKIGSALGDMAGDLAGKLVGQGDYVQTNSLMKSPIADGLPSFGPEDSNIRMRRHEFVGPVYSSVAFKTVTYNINPGLLETFPLLSNIALCFQEYELMGVVWVFVPLATENSAQVGLGSFSAASQYDVDDLPFQSINEILNSGFPCSGPPTRGLVHGVECAPSKRSRKTYFVRGATPVDDLEKYDWCKTTFATEGQAADGQEIGHLYIVYDIKLAVARLVSQLGLTSLNAVFNLSSTSKNIGQTFFGDQPPVYSVGPLQTVFSQSGSNGYDTLTLPNISEGYYKINVIWQDTGYVENDIAFRIGTGTTLSNCQYSGLPFEGPLGMVNSTICDPVAAPTGGHASFYTYIVVIQVTGISPSITFPPWVATGQTHISTFSGLCTVSVLSSPGVSSIRSKVARLESMAAELKEREDTMQRRMDERFAKLEQQFRRSVVIDSPSDAYFQALLPTQEIKSQEN